MKILFQCAFIILFIVSLVLAVGKMAIIDPISDETRTLREKEKRLQEEEISLKQRLSGLKSQSAEGEISKNIGFLYPGKEQDVLHGLVEQASISGVLIQSIQMAKSLTVKVASKEEKKADSPLKLSPGELPPLDSNGMPIGATTDEDIQEEVEGEYLPVQLNLKGTYRGWGKFLQALNSNLPLFVIRNMRIDLDGSGIGKGSLNLVFPLGRKTVSAQ